MAEMVFEPGAQVPDSNHQLLWGGCCWTVLRRQAGVRHANSVAASHPVGFGGQGPVSFLQRPKQTRKGLPTSVPFPERNQALKAGNVVWACSNGHKEHLFLNATGTSASVIWETFNSLCCLFKKRCQVPPNPPPRKSKIFSKSVEMSVLFSHCSSL